MSHSGMTGTAKQHVFLVNMLRHLIVIWKPFSDYTAVISSIEFLMLLARSLKYLHTLGPFPSFPIMG